MGEAVDEPGRDPVRRRGITRQRAQRIGRVDVVRLLDDHVDERRDGFGHSTCPERQRRVPADHDVGMRESVPQQCGRLTVRHLGEGLDGTFPDLGHG